MFGAFDNSCLEFVSYFDIRISNFEFHHWSLSFVIYLSFGA
jgi:hypothetical protein